METRVSIEVNQKMYVSIALQCAVRTYVNVAKKKGGAIV